MAKKKDKKAAVRAIRQWNRNSIEKAVLEVFRANSRKQLNYKQVSKSLEIYDEPNRMLIVRVLKEMTGSGVLEEVSLGKYAYKSQGGQIVGVVDMTSSGNAYIVSDDVVDDVRVSAQQLNHALHGDTVRVHLFAQRRRGRVEGEVLEILSRGRESFVGIVEIQRGLAFLVASAANMNVDIVIPAEALNGAENGDKAIAKIIEWPQSAKNPIGEITRVLGKPGMHETEIHAILAEFELPYEFTQVVEDAAKEIDEGISAAEIAKRRDFRGVPTFTIDPFDAKDFDDALSLRQLENGNWEVGVHIADVTHYIDNSPVLDGEAFERGTSVYLVDRVVPMLPERLSNFICSLRPDEEKLTFSAVFELDAHANLVNEWFGRTVILSNQRFAYEDAQKIIDGEDGPFAAEVRKLDELAKILRAERFRNGALGFERDEVKFNLDEHGKPLGVYYKIMQDSNHLIEEFMLLANKRVATFIGKPKDNTKAKTFVYRVHDDPDPEKLINLSKFVKRFGHKISTDTREQTISSMNVLLKDVKGKSEENLVTTLAIRSMAKAVYSTDNVGHYGLAFDYYTHFTSPIRRYPDVMVHRLLWKYLNGGGTEDYTMYKTWCVHTSKREQLATNAERASIKFKQVEYMSDKIGNVYDGVISGVSEWGFFVELKETKIEGLVPMREMADDYYSYDVKNYCLVGHRHRKVYQLGDPVRVEVLRADLARKVIDFALADEAEAAPRGRRSRKD